MFQGFVRTIGIVCRLLRMARSERCSGRSGVNVRRGVVVVAVCSIGRIVRAIHARGETALKGDVLAGGIKVAMLKGGG